ncbi:MAG: phosphoglycerate kinase [archaeon]
MLLGMKTLDDINVEEKTVLLRVDINCPTAEDGSLLDVTRIKAIVPTVQELSERNAKVVILAHQGRNGKPDCTSLKNHSKALASLLGEEVLFVDKPSGPDALAAIKKASWGDVILLENQRFDEAEQEEKTPDEHANDKTILELAKACDVFVNDAFAAAHRSQRSLVGFCPIMPSAIGRVMEAELGALEKIANPEKPALFIFGGAKLDGIEILVGKLLDSGRADKVIVTGLTGLAFVLSSGHSLGPTDGKIQGELSLEAMAKLAELVEKYPMNLLLPADHLAEKDGAPLIVKQVPTPYPIYDIGPEAASQFTAEISRAKTVFVSGPAGFFERAGFGEGTKKILEAAANRTGEGAHTVIGGGHTNAAISKLGLDGKFSYQSTGGGALEAFITGEKLPVLEAIKHSFKG